ncbi:hypothetical protein FA15DRAFT_91131 [Coprinopsis marcescibilis]|uniref:YEATS domain-containing protein n=1 Tax=Coprinopsis marcescibilis TaxID=230819 RepID=A0A5C3L591_COPMA|nr:hypothetical protein FA15DRAFT_91131 [Coprinopsis marcescibilis]
MTASKTESAVSDIVSQFDTEIDTRTRLAETLQSRIEWAQSLRALLTNAHNSKQTTADSVKRLAIATLVNAEQPADFLFAPPPTSLPPFNSAQNPTLPPPPPVFRRPAPRPKPAGFRTNKGNFLFVNSQNVASSAPNYGEPQYLLLKCPVCGRTTFTSLQGLLNHARITHSIEWGTHDACIKACAVVDNEIDLDSGIEVGLGPSGVLPGLQTLFERAVGVGAGAQAMSFFSGDVNMESSMETVKEEREDVEVPTLTQTLGLHVDTPALAPFLGKKAHRRQINVHDEYMDVDIGASVARSSETARNWKMVYGQRNVANVDAINLGLEANTSVKEFEQEVAPDQAPDTGLLPTGSRFHFAVRIAISDRNLFVPTEKRKNKLHSHKWMIAAESPSYSIPLSSVLKYLKVTPLCAADDYELCVNTVERPPYAVVGTASKPFLAQVELGFDGIRSNSATGEESLIEQTATFEHWVDLDPFNLSTIVVGEEQLVDAELDRRTEIKPACTAYMPIGAKQLWEDSRSSEVATPAPVVQNFSSAYDLLLNVAARFPLTAQGKDRGQVHSVPYTLLSSQSQFKNMNIGRQQAIRWARARAIQEAYVIALEEANIECPAISTAEVFLWLRENERGPSHGAAKTLESEDAANKGGDVRKQNHGGWCGICGLELVLHQPSTSEKLIKQEQDESNAVLEPMSTSQSCSIYQSSILPGLQGDTGKARRRKEAEQMPQLFNSRSLSFQTFERRLVQSVDPNLISLVQGAVADMKLPAFTPLDSPSRYPIDQFGPGRSEVEANLAPHALIALATQRFVQDIVRKGVTQALMERASAMQNLPVGARCGSRHVERSGQSILTPHHIFVGNGLTGS